MSLATNACDTVRERPYLLIAPHAGVINYAAAAAELNLGDDEAVTVAFRRFAADLPPLRADPRDTAMTVRGGAGLVGEDVEMTDGEPVLSVAGVDLAGSDPFTTIIAGGKVDPTVFAAVLSRPDAEPVAIDAMGIAGDTLAVVVPR